MRPLVDKWRALMNSTATIAPSEARATSDEMGAFAFDFYHHLDSDKPDNLIFSPFSIWLALMMVYAGARANTATQMQHVLHLPAAENDLHAQAAALMVEIMRRQLGPAAEDRPELNIQSVVGANWSALRPRLS